MDWLFALRVAGLILLAVWLYFQWMTVTLGRIERQMKSSVRGWHPVSHAWHAKRAFWTLVAIIPFAEALHELTHGRVWGAHAWLFRVHLPAALLLLTAMGIMLFWKNGKVAARTHRRLSWIVIACTPVVAITGFALELGI